MDIGERKAKQAKVEARESLRDALKRIHEVAVRVGGEHGSELHHAAHDIGQAVFKLWGDYLPQDVEEMTLYRTCPVCGALAGEQCHSVPGHHVADGQFHLERVG